MSLITPAQAARMIELVGSDELNALQQATECQAVIDANWQKYGPALEAAAEALKAELGGTWSDAFRAHEAADAASWSAECDAHFLRGMIAANMAAALGLVPTPPAAPTPPAETIPPGRPRRSNPRAHLTRFTRHGFTRLSEATDLADAAAARLYAVLPEKYHALLSDAITLAAYVARFGKESAADDAGLVFTVAEIADTWLNDWPRTPEAA